MFNGVSAARYCPSGDNCGPNIAGSLKKCSTANSSTASDDKLNDIANIVIKYFILFPRGYEP